MMVMLRLAFWALAVCVLYAYAIYPLLVFALARLFGRPVRSAGKTPRSVSIVIAAHNEERNVGRRVGELSELIARSNLDGEIIVVSDGSGDRTAHVAREALASCGAGTTIELPTNRGKAVALNAGCAAARNEIVIFADARQTWAADALTCLLKGFADPCVGAVGGDLVLQSEGGVMAGVGLYWRYEKWLRRQESRFHSTVGATGAIAAVRRELFRPLPPGTILDDVYWPISVAMQGYRVIHEEKAHAYDRLPQRPRDEFCRKVRTLSANFQLVARLPQALFPWRNPIAFQFISHKLLRLLVPWCVLGTLCISIVLPDAIYRLAFAVQLSLLVVGLGGIFFPDFRSRIASAAASFLVLNSAAWLAFWVWVFGRSGRSWKKIVYEAQAPGESRMRDLITIQGGDRP